MAEIRNPQGKRDVLRTALKIAIKRCDPSTLALNSDGTLRYHSKFRVMREFWNLLRKTPLYFDFFMSIVNKSGEPVLDNEVDLAIENFAMRGAVLMYSKVVCGHCGKVHKRHESEIYGGKLYCGECGRPCADCGTWLEDEEEEYEVGGEIYCRDCVEYCDRCEEFVRYGDARTVWTRRGEETWCECCVEYHTHYCENDGEYHSEEDSVYVDSEDSYVSRDYYEDNYYQCNNCGHDVHRDNVYWGDDDNLYCSDCYDERETKMVSVHSYHAWYRNKTLRYFIRGVSVSDGESFADLKRLKTVGIELEVDDGDDADDVIERVMEIDGDKILDFEHDSSLSDRGFETITQPMDLQTFEMTDWESILKCYSDRGFKSHDASNQCSFHMHFSRIGFFGETKEVQLERIAKIYYLFKTYWEDFKKASRRENITRWCELPDAIKTSGLSTLPKFSKFVAFGECIKCIACYSGDHGTAINNSNDDTVEIRIGRGTLNPKSFRAWFDFMYHIVDNAKNIGLEDLDNLYMWFDGISDYTVEYLKKRGAFTDWIGAFATEEAAKVAEYEEA